MRKAIGIILMMMPLIFAGCGKTTSRCDDYIMDIPHVEVQENTFGNEVYIWETFDISTNKAVIIKD